LRGPGMQEWNKGQRPEAATMLQQEDRGPLRQTAATFWKQEGNERDLLEDLLVGDIKASELRRTKEWTLWRGRSSTKRKKKLHTE
jgi:hypothetical protein